MSTKGLPARRDLELLKSGWDFSTPVALAPFGRNDNYWCFTINVISSEVSIANVIEKSQPYKKVDYKRILHSFHSVEMTRGGAMHKMSCRLHEVRSRDIPILLLLSSRLHVVWSVSGTERSRPYKRFLHSRSLRSLSVEMTRFLSRSD